MEENEQKDRRAILTSIAEYYQKYLAPKRTFVPEIAFPMLHVFLMKTRCAVLLTALWISGLLRADTVKDLKQNLQDFSG